MIPQFICPITKRELVEAPYKLVSQLNERIAHGRIRANGGSIVTAPLSSALLENLSMTLYPVCRGVPLLKPVEGISWEQAEGSIIHKGNSYHKLMSEFDFWVGCKRTWTAWTAPHFVYTYTQHFQIPLESVRGKRMLDVGCGPLPTLDWAEGAAMRVGADPLAYSYSQLGSLVQKSSYVACEAETLPLQDDYFDIVASFNALDHVDNLDAAIGELVRVVAPGGLLLVLSDIHDKPTINEPSCFDWGVSRKFSDSFEILEERHLEKKLTGVYDSLHAQEKFNHEDPSPRYGMISLKLLKKGTQLKSAVRPKALPKESICDIPMDRSSIQEFTLALPRFVRDSMYQTVEGLIDEQLRLNRPLAAKEHQDLWRAKVAVTLIKHFPAMMENRDRIETELIRYYLEYGFIADTLIQKILSHITGDVPSGVSDDVPQLLKRFREFCQLGNP